MMKYFKNRIYGKEKNGFAMLFAVLTASFLVAIGTSIFSIALKELMIATSAQDSQRAYYAADSAEECAIYWDLKVGSFPTCLNAGCSQRSTSTPTATVKCNGNDITFPVTPAAPAAPAGDMFTYSNPKFFSYGGLTDPDAGITITKRFNAGLVETRIISQGHNTGILGRRVERGISQGYNQ